MISLHNLIKFNEQESRIQQYEFREETFEDAQDLHEAEFTEENSEREEPAEKIQNDSLDVNSKSEADDEKEKSDMVTEGYHRIEQIIIDNAKKEAGEILKKAKMDAQELKEEALEKGRKEGYEVGYEEGRTEAYRELREAEEKRTNEFFDELKRIVSDASAEKEKILMDYKSSLIDIAVSVAEKVVQVSLKTSGEIIERMILSATERLASKEWVKIYISKTDAELMMEADVDLLQALSNLSDNIQVIPMEKEGQGVCIIEFPDEIIDASANTQVENIREIISNSAV